MIVLTGDMSVDLQEIRKQCDECSVQIISPAESEKKAALSSAIASFTCH